jgi:hypothetical protein
MHFSKCCECSAIVLQATQCLQTGCIINTIHPPPPHITDVQGMNLFPYNSFKDVVSTLD